MHTIILRNAIIVEEMGGVPRWYLRVDQNCHIIVAFLRTNVRSKRWSAEEMSETQEEDQELKKNRNWKIASKRPT